MVSRVQNFFIGLLGENEAPVVEDLFRRATEAGLTFSPDKTKPGPKTVQNRVKNLSTYDDFIRMERELHDNKAPGCATGARTKPASPGCAAAGCEPRDPVKRRRCQCSTGEGRCMYSLEVDPHPGDAGMCQSCRSECECDCRACTSYGKACTSQVSGDKRLNRLLRCLLELRASAQLLRLYRAEVPPGFGPPTLLKIRKVDRDIHEELLRWVAIGEDQLATGLSAYTAGAEKDPHLWAPSLPVKARLPDRGAEAASNATFKDESQPAPTRSSQQPALRDGSSLSGPLPLTKDGRDLGRVCRVCKYTLGDHSNLRLCKEPSKNKGGKGGQQDNRHRSRSPRRKGDGKNQGSPSGRRPRRPPPPCPHWMPNCFTRAPDAYSPNPGVDICLDFNKPDKKCRGRKCMRCHDCPRVMSDRSMCGKKHPAYEHD
jgi:hypothetical protein